MKQLELQISGLDLQKLIEHFTKHKMYRWYPEEIADEVRAIACDEAVIDHFKKDGRYLWYHDEIVAELKSLKNIPF